MWVFKMIVNYSNSKKWEFYVTLGVYLPMFQSFVNKFPKYVILTGRTLFPGNIWNRKLISIKFCFALIKIITEIKSVGRNILF